MSAPASSSKAKPEPVEAEVLESRHPLNVDEPTVRQRGPAQHQAPKMAEALQMPEAVGGDGRCAAQIQIFKLF